MMSVGIVLFLGLLAVAIWMYVGESNNDDV